MTLNILKNKPHKFTTSNRDVLWNAIGSASFAAASFVLAFIAMRFAGPEDGGIFSFAYSTLGQHIFTIAYFGTRAFHITDTKFEYSYKLYKKHRTITTIAAVFVAFLYAFIMLTAGKYTNEKAVLVFLIALLKVCDGYADLLESECQRMGKLWLAGKEMFIRTCLMVLVFAGMLIFGKNIFIAAVTALFCQVLLIILFNISIRESLKEFEYKSIENPSDIPASYHVTLKDLFDETKEIFLVVFLDFYILSAVKYAIDLKMGDEINGIFNILFMPTSIIYLISQMMIKPYLTLMGNAVQENNKTAFNKIIKKLAVFIVLATVICTAGASVLGNWGLSIIEKIFGEQYYGKLSVYSTEFVIIIAGGGLYAAACLYYYVLISLRKQNMLFIIYLVVAVLAFFSANPAISLFGVMGASVCYFLLTAVLMILSFLVSAIAKKQVFGKKE